jgi:hypothetical protein
MTKRRGQDFSKLFFAAPSNDDTRPFSPAAAARPFSPTFTDLVARFKTANENAVLDNDVAAALRRFYLSHSALEAIIEAYRDVADEHERASAHEMMLDALHRMFWATQIRRADDDLGGMPVPSPTPPPPSPPISLAAHDPMSGPAIDVPANVSAGKSTRVTRMPLFRGDDIAAELPQIIRNARNVDFGDDRGAFEIGRKRRKAKWPALAVDNTSKENTDAVIGANATGRASPIPNGDRLWTVAELRNELHPAYWMTRSVPPSNHRGGIFISFSQPFELDTEIVADLQNLLNPRLLAAGLGRALVFTDHTQGTTYGKEFVPEIVDWIRHAVGGFVVQSAPYFNSDPCRLELALLLQRQREDEMPFYPLFGGHHAYGDVPLFVPTRSGLATPVHMSRLGDDRKAHPSWSRKMAGEPLQSLLDIHHKSALTQRLRAAVEDLMRRLTVDPVK